jgi:tripartite-type tricarboxylate transporter receptor subunit TctC
MSITRRGLLAASLAMPALAPWAARAQGWAPNRPVRFVVPFPAGGATDVVARVLGERLQERFGQPVIVENRPGAGGNLGMENVVRSAPDGHTILMGTMGALTINPHLYANMGFDPLKDLAPVSLAFGSDHILIVNNDLPAKTAQEFIALCKANPGKYSYGSAGSGSSTHMVAELFKLVGQVPLEHVPYRGSAPALNDTVAGNVQAMLDQLPSAIGMVQGGKVRPLAITGAKRSRLLPEVPTMAEIGLPQAEATSWGAVMAPAGTPAAVIDRYNGLIRQALADTSVQERLAQAGADAMASTPAELTTYMTAESAKWLRVVKEAKVTVN